MFGLLQQLVYASENGSTFMPTAGTAVAAQVDTLYAFLLIVSAISCIMVIGGLIYFAIKYKRKSGNDKTAYISHNNTLEFLWSFIPFVIFMVVFAWGWFVFHEMRTFPENSLEVHVFAQKWNWSFEYKSGKKTDAELVVPVGQPVKLIMTSKDVLHSFFIPGMRLKQDVVPGRYTALGFNAEREGEYQVFCTEFCGTQHSSMMAKLKVVSQAEYDKWIQENDAAMSLVELGEKIFKGKCNVCHNPTAERKVGPGFKGLFGSKREFESGSTAIADENYIRDSILNPASNIVKSFPNAMTPFQGQLSERELSGIIEYLKTLK